MKRISLNGLIRKEGRNTPEHYAAYWFWKLHCQAIKQHNRLLHLRQTESEETGLKNNPVKIKLSPN